MTSDYRYKNFIYQNLEGKLVLHDFIYDLFYKYEFSGVTDISDYALQLVNKIVDRIYIWQLHSNEINANTLNFYIQFYKYIEQNGGIKMCDRLTDYTFNINNIDGIKTLVQNGILTKNEVSIENDDFTILAKSENISKGKISITVFNIIRNAKDYLILPDEIYNAYKCFDGDSAYKFAEFVIKKMSEKFDNITEDLYKYYAAIFKLIERDKYCITVSDYCKNKQAKSNTEHLKLMIQAQKATMYRINIDEKGIVKETKTNDVSSIDKSAYNTDNTGTPQATDNKEETHKSYLYTQIKNIKSELKKVAYNKIPTENEYKKYKLILSEQKVNIQNVYEYAHHKFELKEIHNQDIITDIDNQHKEIINQIDKDIEKLNSLYSKNKHKDKTKTEKEKVDYYERIVSELNKFEEELNSISEKMVVNSEKDYISFQSKLSNLRGKLHNFYDKSIDEAHENEGLSSHLIKEATTKHNELNQKLDKTFETLELLKKKLMFKNIFNG